MIYATADWHLDHANIIKYTGRLQFLDDATREAMLAIPKDPRFNGWSKEAVKDIKIPLDAVERMNDHIIESCNKVVKRNDFLLILGDFSLTSNRDKIESWLNSINCKHLVFVRGNHDSTAVIRAFRENKDAHYADIRYELKFNDTHFVCDHYPMEAWNKSHYGSIHLFGHVHGGYNEWLATGARNKRKMDVGVDSVGYAPISLEEVMRRLPAFREVDIR